MEQKITLLFMLLGCYVVLSQEQSYQNESVSRDQSERHLQERIVNHFEDEQESMYASSYSCVRNTTHSCSPWSYCDSEDGMCKCPSILQCDEYGQVTDMSPPYCVTYYNNLTEIGLCFYSNSLRGVEDFHKFPPNSVEWNKKFCGQYSRTGTLCGKCREGFYPRAYSYYLTCIECSNAKSNWWKYVLAAFLPLTVFYFLIICLKIKLLSSRLIGFVICNQILASPDMAIYFVNNLQDESFATLQSGKVLLSLFGIWNLDFFRVYNPGVCLLTHPLSTLCLDLAIALYPLLLIIITYAIISLHDRDFKPLVFLWKPFGSCFGQYIQKWEMKTTLVDTFAVFLFLSTVKFLTVTFHILYPVKVYQFSSPSEEDYVWRVHLDATIPYFGSEHLPYATLSIVVFFVFVFLPAVLLLCYPFTLCQKCLNLLPCRWQIFLHIFVDSFQGCYKNGTEPGGSRDCRWFSGLYFVFGIILMGTVVSIQDFSDNSFIVIFLLILAIITINVDPYKPSLKHHSHTFTVFLLLAACFFMCVIVYIGNSLIPVLAMTIVIISLSVVYACFVWIVDHKTAVFRFVRKIRALRQGYSLELMQ